MRHNTHYRNVLLKNSQEYYLRYLTTFLLRRLQITSGKYPLNIHFNKMVYFLFFLWQNQCANRRKANSILKRTRFELHSDGSSNNTRTDRNLMMNEYLQSWPYDNKSDFIEINRRKSNLRNLKKPHVIIIIFPIIELYSSFSQII